MISLCNHKIEITAFMKISDLILFNPYEYLVFELFLSLPLSGERKSKNKVTYVRII